MMNGPNFGIPFQADGTPVDKSDLLPDMSTLLLDDQANTAAIVFAESNGTFVSISIIFIWVQGNQKWPVHLLFSSVITRRLPVFKQLCSNDNTLEDDQWLDDSVATSLIWASSTTSTGANHSNNIWAVSSNNSSFNAPLSGNSTSSLLTTSSNTSANSLDNFIL
jgi:hypothetical protein